jgi:hypothetical protein
LKLFSKNNDYGIIGLAGTTWLPKSGMWWEDRTKMFGIVNHKQGEKKWESKYSNSLENNLKSVILVDGLFIAINKTKIKKSFDESVEGFHMYDVNFCVRNFLNNVKIGVTTNIRVTHLSVGMTNDQWEKNRNIFAEKYEEKLPLKVKFDKNDILKILFITDNLVNNSFLSKILELDNNMTKHILINKSTKDSLKLCNKKNISVFDKKNIPGLKIGDGKWLINNNGKLEPSQKDFLYNISNIFYDIIISDSLELLNFIRTTFNNSPKILLGENNISLHNSISLLNTIDGIDLQELILSTINHDKEINNKIKIISGYSEKGGSTTAFINLTNELNKRGYNCTFYGPHKWHLSKCNSDLLSNFKFETDDRVICHYINLPKRPEVRKIVFSCHEKWWWSFNNLNKFWDTGVFLHEKHKQFHSYLLMFLILQV